MNVIVCGVDRSGKTTLTNQLKTDLGFNRVHFTCPKPDLKDDDHVLVPNVPVFNQILDYYVSHLQSNMIYDRFIYSDIVYGPIYRKPDDIAFRKTEQTFMELLMQSHGDVVIYARVEDFDQNLSLVEDENEGVLDKQLLKDIRDKYDGLMRHVSSICPVFAYDWHKPNAYSDALAFIRENCKAYDDEVSRFAQAGIHLYDYYAGPFMKKPSKVIAIEHGQGVMTYDDFLYACTKDLNLFSDPTVGVLKVTDDVVQIGNINKIFKEHV